eukprot:gene33796-43555_t
MVGALKEEVLDRLYDRYVASTGTDSTDQAHTPAGEARRRSFEEQEPQLGAIHGHHTLRNPRPANPEVHSMDMMSDMAAAKTAMDTASQYDVVFEPHPMRKWEIPIMSRRQGWRNAGNE